MMYQLEDNIKAVNHSELWKWRQWSYRLAQTVEQNLLDLLKM